MLLDRLADIKCLENKVFEFYSVPLDAPERCQQTLLDVIRTYLIIATERANNKVRNHETDSRPRASSDRSTFNQENATSRRERKNAERKEKRDKGRKAKKAAAAALKLTPLTNVGNAPKPPAPHSAPRPAGSRRTDGNGNSVSKADLAKQSCFLSIFGVCPRSSADCDRTHRPKEHLSAAEKPEYEAWAKLRAARVGQGGKSGGGKSGGKGGKSKGKGKGKGKGKDKGKGKKGGKGGGKGAKGGKSKTNDGICNSWKKSGVCDKGKDCTYSHPDAFKGSAKAAAAYKVAAVLYTETEEQDDEEPTYSEKEWAEWEAVDCDWTEVDYPDDEEYDDCASNYEEMDP